MAAGVRNNAADSGGATMRDKECPCCGNLAWCADILEGAIEDANTEHDDLHRELAQARQRIAELSKEVTLPVDQASADIVGKLIRRTAASNRILSNIAEIVDCEGEGSSEVRQKIESALKQGGRTLRGAYGRLIGYEVYDD
jgi:hypothetical protein